MKELTLAMRLITRKSEIKEILELCIEQYRMQGLDILVTEVHRTILANKVKFPLLEFCGESIFKIIPENEHIIFCDKIEELKTEGGNVLLGIILQKRLNINFHEAIDKTVEYVAKADVWYVCDIIGERVFGYSLLNYPDKSIPEIKRLSMHPTNWVVRSLGAGIHNAVRKGLDKKNVSILFEILLSMSNTKDKEIRQGVGWAAKTTAKFHPNIIDDYKTEINNNEEVANWFRKKIEIGLNRHNYAKRN
ncbi:MAG: DNA alkylation repair protein [Flavobacteriales bacterium]